MKLKKSIKIILFIIFILLLISQTFLIKSFFDFVTPKEDEETSVLLKYDSMSNSTYRVRLKDNQFIPDNQVNSEAYILSFVDYITYNIEYSYNATKAVDLNGVYTIQSSILVYHRISSDRANNPKIWEKSDIIKEVIINENTSTLKIIETFDVYIDEYQNQLDEFKKSIENVNVEAELQIKVTADFTGSEDGVHFDEDYLEVFTIPLDTQIFSISNNETEAKNNTVYYQELVAPSVIEALPLTILNLVNFILLILVIKVLFFFNSKSKYEQEKNKIAKYYDEIIVNTTSLIDEDKYEIIEIQNFKELYELSRELNMPIMQYNYQDGLSILYYVLKNDTIYKFVLHEL